MLSSRVGRTLLDVHAPEQPATGHAHLNVPIVGLGRVVAGPGVDDLTNSDRLIISPVQPLFMGPDHPRLRLSVPGGALR